MREKGRSAISFLLTQKWQMTCHIASSIIDCSVFQMMINYNRNVVNILQHIVDCLMKKQWFWTPGFGPCKYNTIIE